MACDRAALLPQPSLTCTSTWWLRSGEGGVNHREWRSCTSVEGSWWERTRRALKVAVTKLQFADDVAVLGPTREEIERTVNVLEEVA